MSKGSDINVSSIEEDIKILQELMEDVELTFAGWVDILNEREKKALKNLIQDYTRQKQINEEHRKENGLLREEVKELEKNIEKISESSSNNEELIEKLNSGETFTVNQLGFIKKNFIPKQKIKDKVEEIRHKKEEYEEKGEGLQINDFFHRKFIEATHKIRALEELLQESEENNHAK